MAAPPPRFRPSQPRNKHTRALARSLIRAWRHYHHLVCMHAHKNLASSLLSMAGPARTHTRAHRRRRSTDSSTKHYTIAQSNNPSAHAPYARTGLLPSIRRGSQMRGPSFRTPTHANAAAWIREPTPPSPRLLSRHHPHPLNQTTYPNTSPLPRSRVKRGCHRRRSLPLLPHHPHRSSAHPTPRRKAQPCRRGRAPQPPPASPPRRPRC